VSVYYNEFDPFAAAWLRELIKDGLIADGEVDERSILDVRPRDLRGFTQCHFFAGIGGWSAAARLAGWSDDRPMWTGSPPCQPFSTAGNRKGKDDERHLWPVFFDLIRECAPPVVFGEQVAAAIRSGWFDDLQTDMEAEGYATGMVVLPACSVGAPHKRDRLWYVAERMDNANTRRHEPEKEQVCSGRQFAQLSELADGVADTYESGQSAGEGRGEGFRDGERNNAWRCGSDGGMADTNDQGLQRYWGLESKHDEKGREISIRWIASRSVNCRDGKYRTIPTEPEIFPLANGVSNRVGLLRGAGNAIVQQVAAEVIGAYMEVCE